jgi:shikimate kinase
LSSKIYLCGMMGSGKTAIGRRLAPLLGWEFFDLDEEIDRALGHSFHELVRERGWIAFRELEYSLCKEMTQKESAVIALGGGTVRFAWNRDLLRGTGLIVLLEASLDQLARRIRPAERPRVNPGATLDEDLRLIWEASEATYREAADVVLRTDDRSLDETLAELERVIRRELALGS